MVTYPGKDGDLAAKVHHKNEHELLHLERRLILTPTLLKTIMHVSIYTKRVYGECVPYNLLESGEVSET